MTAPAARANAVYLSDVEAERLRWRSPGRLAAGKLTLLDGDPGLGKSTLLMDWAACVTTGRALPDGEPDRPRGVVLLSAEDGLGDTIRPRLEAAGADLTRVVALLTIPDGTPEGRLPELPADVPYVRQLIEQVDAALLIIDPLMAYLGASVNSWRDQDARRALAPLAMMADETGAAVIVVRHLNKAQSANALYRGGGSIGIIGAARCGLLLAADPDDAERRILAPTKSNLARPPASLAFTLEPVPGGDVARIAYLGTSAHSASALLSAPQDDDARSAREETRTARQEAEAWLLDLLDAGPVSAKEATKRARADGIADRTLDRAKAALGVKAERSGGFGDAGAWSWRLPDDTPKSAIHTPKGAKSANPSLSGDHGGLTPAVAPIDALNRETRSLGAIWTCAGCGLPRSRDDQPCPACGATQGRWLDPSTEAA